MMKLRHLFENYQLAREALTHWEHQEEGLEELLTHFRISSNAVYPFRRAGALCFLRLAPEEEKREQNLQGELEFIQWLRGRGYPALEPIPADGGEPYLLLDTPWGRYYASAFRGAPGIPMEDATLTPALITAYGALLGELHALSAQYVPRTRKWDHREALDWIASVLAAYDAPEGARRELERLRADLEALPAGPGMYGLVHYDFEPDNVFYDADTGAFTVIDFDDGMYHWYALDVEQALDALENPPEGAEEAFLSGYTSRFAYPAQAQAARPVLRRFVNLYAYARLLRAVAERFPEEPDWLTELRKKLAAAMERKSAGWEQ